MRLVKLNIFFGCQSNSGLCQSESNCYTLHRAVRRARSGRVQSRWYRRSSVGTECDQTRNVYTFSTTTGKYHTSRLAV